MQAIVETVFDAVYLVSVITIGILMIRGCKGSHQLSLLHILRIRSVSSSSNSWPTKMALSS